MMKFQKQKRTGFTLVEIIIVVTITLFLLVATVQGFVNSSSQFRFNNAYQRIEAMILAARSLAISGKAQVDYTDYDNDGCREQNDPDPLVNPPCPNPAEDDYVTPAHYSVDFRKNTAGDFVVTMFADMHNPKSSPGQEGQFLLGTSPSDYQSGKDILIDQNIFSSSDLTFIFPPTAPTYATIFYSPIYADISFDPPTIVDVTNPFFRFGLLQNNGPTPRKRCSEIHQLSGISEPLDFDSNNLSNPVCP